MNDNARNTDGTQYNGVEGIARQEPCHLDDVIQLLPCPFCGTEVYLISVTDCWDIETHDIKCENTKCIMSMGFGKKSIGGYRFDYKDQLIKLWNKRQL